MSPLAAAAWRIFPLVRHLSNLLSPVLIKLPVTPNQVTAASLACGLAGAACFTTGQRSASIFGAFLMICGYVLDNCDGDIARAKNLRSKFGHYFDSVTDWLVDSAFFLCLGIGASAHRDQSVWLWLGVITAVGATVSYFLELRHDLAAARGEKADPVNAGTLPGNLSEALVYIFRELTRADFCFIVLALAYYDVAWVLLPLGAVGAQAYWLTSLFVSWRRFHV